MAHPGAGAGERGASPVGNRRQRRRQARRAGGYGGRPGRQPLEPLDGLLAAALRHHQLGRPAEAQDLYERILEHRPRHADALHLLGVIALQRGESGRAAGLIREAIEVAPGAADYHNNLGLALMGEGEIEAALAVFGRALELVPDHAPAHNNRGNALKALGRLDEAIEAYREALAVDRAYTEAHNNLGNALTDLGRLDEAVAAYRRALEINPSYAEAHNNLASALQAQGNLDGAVAGYERALTLKADFVEAYNNLGAALLEKGQADAALERLETAIALRPDYAEARNNLGNALRSLGRLGAAEAAIREALALKPEFLEAHTNLGNVLSGMGRCDEAIASLRLALAQGPDAPDAHRCLLLATLYSSSFDHEALFAEHRRFEARYAAPLYAGHRPHANAPEPERRLRIGYLSSDFRRHPVAYNIAPLLENRDAERFEAFCYAEVSKPDEMTAHLRALADGWRWTRGRDDAAVAEAIRSDGVDILVCTAAHLDENRPLVCAHRPAPVQVSYHDVATSGMAVMDYLLTDAVLHPADTGELFAEELVRLPTFYAFPPLDAAPPVAPPPASEPGRVTFASFNNPAKLTPQTIALWSRVLAALPHSRLLLKFRDVFACETTRTRFEALFAENGVARERVEFAASSDKRERHLALYEGVDIALDPFPFNGTTTTFEALWMGVPVVTLAGERFTGRVSLSLLTPLGLSELAAASADEYVAVAQALACDLPRLRGLRATLRERVAASALCDGPAYAAQVEGAFRWMWRRWCAGGG